MSQDESSQSGQLKPMIPWKLTLSVLAVAIISSVIVTYFTYSGAFPFQNPLGIYRFLPGDILVDLLWVYVIPIIVGLIVYFLTPSMAMLFWRVHRLAKGGTQNYYIQARTGEAGISSIRRLLTPAFTALGLSFSLSGSTTQGLIFVTENFQMVDEREIAIITAMPILFISLLIATMVLVIFAPVWLLDDVGLISEKKTRGARDTVNIEGVGHFFSKYLKGFAGISTVVAYLLTAYEIVGWYQFITSQGELIYPIVVYLFPVSVIFAAPLIALAPIAIANIFYELSIRKNADTILEKLEKSGVAVASIEPIAQSPSSA
jgi:hypothetical protein